MAGSGLIGMGAGSGGAFAAAGSGNGRDRRAAEPAAHDIVFDDASGHGWSYAGATLSLARRCGADADDRFGATGTLSALIEGGALVIDGVRVGIVTQNSGGRLFLTFSGANASEDHVDAVLRQITYANAARDPNGPVDLHWTFRDGHAGPLIAEGRTRVAVDHAPIWRSPRRGA